MISSPDIIADFVFFFVFVVVCVKKGGETRLMAWSGSTIAVPSRFEAVGPLFIFLADL